MQHQDPKTDGSLHSPGKTAGNRKGLDDRHASGRSEKAEESKPEADVPPDGMFLDPEFAEANRVTLRELEKDGDSDAHESPDEAAGDDVDQRRDPH